MLGKCQFLLLFSSHRVGFFFSYSRGPANLIYYDPNVFKVKPSALKAHCSDRVKELAEPIVR